METWEKKLLKSLLAKLMHSSMKEDNVLYRTAKGLLLRLLK
jgi:hypothetical protein